MKKVFADTFYWLSLTNPHDSDHARAQAFGLLDKRPILLRLRRS